MTNSTNLWCYSCVKLALKDSLIISWDSHSLYNGELLENNNYKPIILRNFKNSLNEIIESSPDLILLDINIPYINGEKLLQDLRKTSNIPVIMVTSRNSEIDEALSISYGADDYITKPYNPNILLLRIGAVLKRTNAKSNVLSYKDLKINVQKGIIKKEDVEIILTKNEMIIFCFLLSLALTSHSAYFAL